MKIAALALIVHLLAAASTLHAQDEWQRFQKLIKSRDVDERCKAIREIESHKNLKMAQALLPVLEDEHARVVYKTVEALVDVDADALKYLVNAGLRHASPKVRRGTAEVLGIMKAGGASETLQGTLKDRDTEVAAEAALSLGQIASKGSVDALADAVGSKAALLRANALDALSRIDIARAEPLCRKATEDSDYQVRLVAAEAAPRVSPEFGIEVGQKLINDRDWRVRVSVIESTLQTRRRESITTLVERMEKEEGRLRWDILIALLDLTGENLGLLPQAWKDWWNANKETFEIPEQNARGGDRPDVGSTRSEFFEVPILSTRIVFILDLSGSMRDDAPPEQRRNSKIKTMLDVAKFGMSEAIRSLEPDVHFGITGLGGKTDHTFPFKHQKTWRKNIALHPAVPANKTDALKFVQGVDAAGYSNDFDAIAYAFEDPNVDTIYLYGDGGTSRGTFVASGEILDNIRKMNRFRKIMIHTIEVPGDEPNRADNTRFLENLARETKGTSKLVNPSKSSKKSKEDPDAGK